MPDIEPQQSNWFGCTLIILFIIMFWAMFVVIPILLIKG